MLACRLVRWAQHGLFDEHNMVCGWFGDFGQHSMVLGMESNGLPVERRHT